MKPIRSFGKKIYHALPDIVKKNLLLFLRKFYVPQPNLMPGLIFKGHFTVGVSKGRSFKIHHTGKWIENDLFWYGIGRYEKISMDTWIKACIHAEVIFDIGANTGVFSLVAKAVNPNARIYAFEPVPLFQEQLKQNIQLNKFNISVEAKAVSDENKIADFFFPTAGNVYSASLSQEHYKMHNETPYIKTQVEVCTLESFIRENKISKIDLIKIDAEGFDFEVLKGMGEFLQRFKPDILVEVHSDEIGYKIQTLLAENAYLFYNIDEINSPKLETEIKKSNGLNFFLCKPDTARKISL